MQQIIWVFFYRCHWKYSTILPEILLILHIAISTQKLLILFYISIKPQISGCQKSIVLSIVVSDLILPSTTISENNYLYKTYKTRQIYNGPPSSSLQQFCINQYFLGKNMSGQNKYLGIFGQYLGRKKNLGTEKKST